MRINRGCLALNDDVSLYQKLPQLQLLKLSVLKLDGSVFGDSLLNYLHFYFFLFFYKLMGVFSLFELERFSVIG